MDACPLGPGAGPFCLINAASRRGWSWCSNRFQRHKPELQLTHPPASLCSAPPQGHTPSQCLWQLLLHKEGTLSNPETFNRGLLVEKFFLISSPQLTWSEFCAFPVAAGKNNPQNCVSLLPPASASWQDVGFGLGAAGRRSSHTEAASEGEVGWEQNWHEFGNVWSTVKRKSNAQSPQGIFVNQL